MSFLKNVEMTRVTSVSMTYLIKRREAHESIEELVDAYGLSPDDYFQTPTGAYFVKASVRMGLLPQILEQFIVTRKKYVATG
ncbi:unnamed protein product [Dibothriocephalus latus]|uniref:Uncharacterized protein n=1 Tax=Dibothriocephalus latus TaxID=60516 RepID=A0A3P7PQ54_DIBLA|nr:unnamed protein product [Dibothriocephalus latus]